MRRRLAGSYRAHYMAGGCKINQRNVLLWQKVGGPVPTATELKWPEKYPSQHTCYVLRSEGPCRRPHSKQLKIYPDEHRIFDQRTEGPRRWPLGKIAQKAIRRTEELWSKVGRSVPMATIFFFVMLQSNQLTSSRQRSVGPCQWSLSFLSKLHTELPFNLALSRAELRHWIDSKRFHL